jgi:probable phosphoglycerate mutase
MHTRLFLVRHGESEGNLRGRVQGQSESPLTDRGRAQARAAGRALRNRGIRHVYSSDLERARESAELIDESLGLGFAQDPRLREMCFGQLEGLAWSELDVYYAEAEARGEGDWYTHRPPGGESRAELTERVVDTLSDLVDRHRGETLLLVSHGGFIGFLLRRVLGLPGTPRYVGFRTPNGAIHRFDHRDERFHLVTWAEQVHLDGL